MLNLKRLCFAAVAVTAGSGAFAAINGPNSAGADVFVAVWNPSTNSSVVEDLGITESAFESANGTGSPTQIDGSSSAFQSLLQNTGGGFAGDLYVVFSGDAGGANAAGNFFNGTFSNFTNTATVTLDQQSNQAIATALGNFVQAQMVQPNLSTITASGTTNTSAYWAKGAPGPNPGGSLGLFGFDAAGALGSNLNYWTALNNGPNDASDDQATITQQAGFWNLSTAGVLTWTANGGGGPTTPLPAAVWMFLSGLLGLGTVSRRKSAG